GGARAATTRLLCGPVSHTRQRHGRCWITRSKKPTFLAPPTQSEPSTCFLGCCGYREARVAVSCTTLESRSTLRARPVTACGNCSSTPGELHTEMLAPPTVRQR